MTITVKFLVNKEYFCGCCECWLGIDGDIFHYCPFCGKKFDKTIKEKEQTMEPNDKDLDEIFKKQQMELMEKDKIYGR